MTHPETMGGVPPHSRTLAGEARALASLALPIVTVQVGIMLMGVVDTIMIGRVSAEALAAVALGNLYYFALSSFGLGTLLVLDPVVSQAIGARDTPAVTRALQRGMFMSLLLTLPAACALLAAHPVFTFLRQPLEVVPIAAGYSRASILGVFPFLLFIVFRQTLQAMKRVAPVVWTIVAANLCNVGLNWILVYGKMGAPTLGAVGTGWASSLSRCLMAGLLLALSWRELRPHLAPLAPRVAALAPILRMFKVGAPVGAQFMLEGGVFSVVALLMGMLGAVQVASHHVAISIAALTFMVPMGISSATTVLVGHAVGRADAEDARAASRAALVLGVGFMAVMASIMIVFPLPLARIYTVDPSVVGLAAALIPIAGVFQVFDGLQVVAIGILRGVGDTRTPLIVNVLGFWLLGLPISLLLAFPLGYGPRGLWWGLVAGLAAVALGLIGRLRARLREELKRLVIDEAHELEAATQF